MQATRYRIAALAMIALLGGGARAQTPEELQAEREKILGTVGRVVERRIPLHPLGREVGKAFTQPVAEAGAAALRVRFVVRRAPAGPTWGVVLRDEGGDVAWSAGAAELEGSGFWSPEVAGAKLTVEVYSVERDSPLELEIDGIAAQEPGALPLTISGSDDLQPIRGQERWIEEAGESVARLRIVGDHGGMYVCTGFLVAPDLLLTNQHCIASEAEMRSALVDFDYDGAGAPFTTVRLKELCASDYALDYALVRLEAPAGREFLPLAPGAPLDDGQPLVIVQHPAGEPKQVSLRGCEVDGAHLRGRGSGAALTDFGHPCDTLKGSSGSPVLDRAGRRVVGLHRLGFRPDSGLLVNSAVYIDRVLDHVAGVDRGLVAEIPGLETAAIEIPPPPPPPPPSGDDDDDDGESGELPEFPWPPPEPSSRAAMPRTLLALGENPLLGDVWERLNRALADAGYLEQSVYRVPDGFAVATRPERTLANGEPDPEARWSLDRFPPGRWSLLRYLRALLTVDPGRFRVFVFAVTTDRSREVGEAVSSDVALEWVRSGALEPPASLRAQPFTGDHAIHILIYEFSRPNREAEVEQLQPGELAAETHLRASGVLDALGDSP